MNQSRRSIPHHVAFGFALLVVSTSVPAATIVVTATTNSGAGSLRQALIDANHGDTVTFDLPAPSTIAVPSVLSISKDITLRGPGRDMLILDGGSSSGVIQVGGADAVIAGLTLRHGRNFGLRNLGRAVLRDCAVTGNVGGGGLENQGNLTISECVFQDNRSSVDGGGIYNAPGATLSVERSTFRGNFARFGGGIYNSGSVLIEGSTFVGNRRDHNRGAGALYNDGIAVLNNSTVVDNEVGAVLNFSQLTITSSTIVGNGPFNVAALAVANFDRVTISRSILLDTCRNDAPSATITSGGDNIAFAELPHLENPCVPLDEALNDRVVDDSFPFPPLADNGGPTLTYKPPVGSLAIDGVEINSCTGVDQRGMIRPIGPRCDIGAVESEDADVLFRTGFDG